MGTQGVEWKYDTNEEHVVSVKTMPLIEIYDHPLKPTVISMTELHRANRRIGGSTSSSTGSSTPIPTPTLDPLGLALDGTDPLSHFSRLEMDPLSKLAAESDWDSSVPSYKKNKETMPSDSIEPWSSRKSAILAKFTTSEKLSIITSFLSGGEKVVVKAQSTTVDKVKTRLEQLDEFEEGSVRQMRDLTQQEYMSRIEQLNAELITAWNADQRVRALKIVIQCAKLLVDTTVMPFYPSKFVLITDILDTFGKLVYERLRTKSEYDQHGSSILPENFTPDMVPESAKETCRNWFYKIASIRELVPRLYVEMAILKSYSFLTTSEFSAALMRLTRMIRGIGHPLVAVYARCYLCRVGMLVSTPNTDRKYLTENFYDFLSSYNQVLGNGIRAELQRQRVEVGAYYTLYTPALDWLLQTIAIQAPVTLLDQLLERCQQKSNSGLLLNTIMASFKASCIADRSLQFVEMITKCNDEGFPPYILFRTLGMCLALAPPPYEHRRSVLNGVWRVVSSLTEPQQYISCAEIWIQYAVSNFSTREVNTFLGDIIRHMSPNRSYENHYPQLLGILEKVVTHTQDFESLLMTDNFLPLLDLFQRENVRVEACRGVMTAYTNQSMATTDPIIINTLMFICKVLHDSVNALTVDDERRQIGSLVNNFVKRVEYGRDFEQQLNFYVDARAAFTNFDLVLSQLVQCVNRLSVETRHVVKGHHTRKTGAFVRACAAYCYITVPSIASVCTRLELYLLSGQVALFNQCLGQADACFKASLSLIPELPQTIEIDGKQCNSEQFLIGYLRNFLSTLLIVPDSPDMSVLYLTRGLVNVLQHYTWGPHSFAQATVYLSVIDLLAVAARDTYPYHVDKVDSNDSLYGSDPKFISEINKMAGIIVDELLVYLKHLGQTNQIKAQSTLAVELCTKIILRGDISQPSLATLGLNLWQLAQKHGQADIKYLNRTLVYFKQKSSQVKDQSLLNLISKFKIMT